MLDKKNRVATLVISITLVLLLCVYSKIQAETKGESEAGIIDSYLRLMPSARAKAMSGKVEVIDAEAEYSYECKLFDSLPSKFSLGNKYVSIENSTAVELPAHLVGVTTYMETTLPLFNVEKTYLRIGISPSFYGDNWDFSPSDFRLPLHTFLIYKPTTQWTFLAGIAVYPDFEQEVLPLAGFIYKPNDRLTFNIVPRRPNISYLLNERTTLFAEGGSSFGEYEVTKENLKSAVLIYKEMHIGCGVRYKFNTSMYGSFQAGATFNRYLKYRDSLGKVNIKNGAYVEFRLELKI